MIYENCAAYIGGKYAVHCSTKSGKGFFTVCDTEQEARAYGNEQWKKPYIVEVDIVKMGFNSRRRRKSILIAKAEKRGITQ